MEIGEIMATRWKSEPTHTLILMHAHNRWSMWNSAILEAAEQLGLPIGETNYQNCSGDGSWDQEYYTLESAINKIGKEKLYDLAHKIHGEIYDY